MLDKDLIALLGDDKKVVLYVTLVDLIGLLANIAVTACICVCVDLAFTGGGSVGGYALWIGLALLFAIVKAATVALGGKLKNGLGGKVKRSMRGKIYRKLTELGLQAGGEDTAALTQTAIEGVEQVDTYYTAYLPSFFNAMIAPVILFVVCICFRWQVGLVLIACLPLIPLSIAIVSKRARKIFDRYWDKYTSMGNAFLDNLQGMKELKIFAADGLKQAETAVKSEEFRKITMKVLVMQLASLTIIDTVAFGAAGVAIVLAVTGATAEVDPLSPAAALFLILLSAEFFLPMRSLASAFHVSMNGSTAGKKIKTFLKTEAPRWGDKLPETPTEIALAEVEFSYDGARNVLSGVNAAFRKGFHAIVGESGSGKSTIAALLTGAYAPQKGAATLNGIPVREYDRAAFYKRVATVGYNTFLFNASIRENFKLADENVTDSEIREALERVNLVEFIEAVGGPDFVIMEDSENISGGERQRLALAVNLIADKDIYLFDEATSNIDVESEAIIMRRIRELAREKIVLVISHRLQNVVAADSISLIDDGRVTERGTHDELMLKNGKYAAVYRAQYALENGFKEVCGRD